MKNGSCTTGCGSVWLECTAGGREVAGSNPAPAIYAQIAQLVEQRTENPRVTGSIPVLGTLVSYQWGISSVGRALDF